MTERQKEKWGKLCGPDGEAAIWLFADCYRTQIPDNGFREHLRAGGCLEPNVG